ncbi:MAG: hypothetical protein OXH15_04945 [Gammaproteobacteria bacterium]|nr:hypothetical protein [Gammaproteobacteria bacterium]
MDAGSSQPDLQADGLRRVRLADWARARGIARITAYRMLQRGILPVPTERSPTGRWYVLLPDTRTDRMAFYTRATPSPDQAIVINEQIATLSEWSAGRRQRAYIVIKEIAAPLTDNMPKLAQLLADQRITEIAVASPTVVGEGLFQLLVAALAPQGRTITAAVRDGRRTRTDDLRFAIIHQCKLLHGPKNGAAAARRALEYAP